MTVTHRGEQLELSQGSRMCVEIKEGFLQEVTYRKRPKTDVQEVRAQGQSRHVGT